MKAVFIGKNGSMGFKKGKKYQIKTRVEGGCLWVIDLNTGKTCPYGSLEPLLDNWKICRDPKEEASNDKQTWYYKRAGKSSPKLAPLNDFLKRAKR